MHCALKSTFTAMGLLFALHGSAAESSRPNLLLIVADDLGYSDLGAFGGEIRTPNLDALASNGRVLTNFHTAAACSPTRAELMTGRDHHQAGLGTMIAPDAGQRGKPGYEGYLPATIETLPERLRGSGYRTYMVGKWHLGSGKSQTPAERGFDASFVLLEGGGSHFAPVPGKPQFSDNFHWVENGAPAALPADFYSSNTMTDKLLDYIGPQRNTAKAGAAEDADRKPFFGYLAFTAPHWPLHAPADFIDRYRGRYDAGYDAIRAQRIERQKALGIIPKDFRSAALTPASPHAPRWDELDAAQKKSEARAMEIYAAMVENLDWNVGRVIAHLKAIGEYDNTFIVFISDNGAEGGPVLIPNTPSNDNSYANLGRPLSNIAYGRRWGEVGATPFALWKAFATEGGISVPALVKLPRQSAALPMLRSYMHAADLFPTFLQLAGAGPDTRAADIPLAGKSALGVLSSAAPAVLHPAADVRADELFGRRYVRRGQWKLVWNEAPWGSGRWQLFDIEKDRGETVDVAAAHPQLVAALSADFDRYAQAVGAIMPLQPGLGAFQEPF